jgi:ADP-ribose pyrophosphatase
MSTSKGKANSQPARNLIKMKLGYSTVFDWKKLRQTSRKIGYRTITTKTFIMPDGLPDEYATHGAPGSQSAAVVALTPDYQVVAARQFRPGPEKIFDELPGGAVEEGENPLDAARRELKEETGYEPGRIEPLGTVWRDAYINSRANYFIAYDCVRTGDPKPDDREFVETALITIDELLTVARSGRMSDVPGVFLAYETLLKIQTEAL